MRRTLAVMVSAVALSAAIAQPAAAEAAAAKPAAVPPMSSTILLMALYGMFTVLRLRMCSKR